MHDATDLLISKPMELQGTVALVTGANRGLGLAFAKGLLEAGAAKVYAGARDPSTVTEPGLTPVRLWVTDPERVGQAAQDLPDVNVLINNAGVASLARILESDIDEARRLY